MFTLSGLVERTGEAAVASQAVDDALIEVGELRDRLAANNPPTLVDLRPQEMFVLAHIPGSLNLRFHELRGSALLRANEIVLIEEGHRSRELAEQAGSLRVSGRLLVLDGGLRAWQMSGDELQGLGPDSTRLFELDPGAMLRHRADLDWQWVLVTDDAAPGPQTDPAPGDMMQVRPADLPAFLARAAASQAGPRHRLILDREGQSYARLEREVRGADGAVTFYLAGGWQGFAAASLRMRTIPRLQVLTSAPAGDRSAARSGRPAGSGSSCCGGKR